MIDAVHDAVLLNPAWSSLTGAHAHLAQGSGRARRYEPDVSPFCAVTDTADPQAWSDLAALVGPGGIAFLTGPPALPADGWTRVDGGNGVQLVGADAEGRPDDALLVLGTEDVPEMLALVERTQPGPFMPRTVELGGYLGIRVDGRLAAMAGRRLAPDGYVEISAVCTDADQRGQGLASRLVRAVVAGIQAEGRVPIMHAHGGNENAIRLYEALGFRIARRPEFALFRAPA